MIVRILNDKEGTDRFYDCRNSCLRTREGEQPPLREEKTLIFEFAFALDASIEVVLRPNDDVYYMNDNGKTVHIDRRMGKPK